MRKLLQAQKWIVPGGLIAVCSTVSNAAVVIPDTGVDGPGYVSAAILVMGAVAAAVVGGYFGFLVIKAMMRWAGKALN